MRGMISKTNRIPDAAEQPSTVHGSDPSAALQPGVELNTQELSEHDLAMHG